MNRKRTLLTFALLTGFLFLYSGCNKDKDDNGEPASPSATTRAATMIGRGWATLNATIDPKNLPTAISFEYDTTSAFQNSVDAVPDSITDNAIGFVLANISGLIPGITYQFRVRAENKAGVTYGSSLSFTTTTPKDFVINFNPDITYGTVTDFEGNTYNTVAIGSQTWMAENLRALKLNDGTDITLLPDNVSWSSAESPGYCWFDSDSLGYGALYNWQTVNTGKLCPAGWHVPTDAEWTTLINTVGGSNAAGGSLKETGIKHWFSPNSGATNASGFTALPGGYRSHTGTFRNIGSSGYWWSSTESLSTEAWYRSLSNNYINADRASSPKKSGLSVRCVQDWAHRNRNKQFLTLLLRGSMSLTAFEAGQALLST